MRTEDRSQKPGVRSFTPKAFGAGKSGIVGVRRRSLDRADSLDRQVSPSELCEVTPSPRRRLLAPDFWLLTPRREAAFSLVEVTLALVVMAIGLIAILGLIPQGVTSSRSAADNTLVATIAHDIFNTIRTQPFINVNLSAYGFGVSLYSLQNSYPPPQVTTYFDQAGLTLTPATLQADSYFRVDLSVKAQNPPTPAVLSVITATVTWPAKPGVTWPLHTNVFVTAIANYQ